MEAFLVPNLRGGTPLAERNRWAQAEPEENTTEIVDIPIEEGVLRPLLGPGDNNLHYLQRFIGSKVTVRREKLLVRGTPADNSHAVRVLSEMISQTRRKGHLTPGDVDSILRLSGAEPANGKPTSEPVSSVFRAGERIYGPRAGGQDAYFRAILACDLVFGIGPAGTGKTFIAVLAAVQQFLSGRYDRIILTRPVVEAGESLGYLPGDIREKVDPYFRPLYDSLMKLLPAERLRKFLDRNVIEVAPLAYMRGRTLENAFVILDEAQNTTVGQMKMLLTRLGDNSKAVVTGDLTQIDLQPRTGSGLLSIQEILKDVPGVRFVYFDASDVVRHPLVARIIGAYEDYHSRQMENGETPASEVNGDLPANGSESRKPVSEN